MKVVPFERNGVRIVECLEVGGGASEALELISGCMEHGAELALVEARHLPPEFFELRSGFAGELLQKLANYGVRLAGVFPTEAGYAERFREFLLEAKRGRAFRAFGARADAEAWLAAGS